LGGGERGRLGKIGGSRKEGGTEKGKEVGGSGGGREETKMRKGEDERADVG